MLYVKGKEVEFTFWYCKTENETHRRDAENTEKGRERKGRKHKILPFSAFSLRSPRLCGGNFDSAYILREGDIDERGLRSQLQSAAEAVFAKLWDNKEDEVWSEYL